jgi:hypothetical protein
MALTTYLSYNLAPKQRIVYIKNSNSSVAFIPQSISHSVGTPGSVPNPVTQPVSAAGSTASGLLVTPQNKTGGYTLINNGGQKYITQVGFYNSVSCNLQIFDKIVEYAISPLSLGTITCTNIDMGTRKFANFQQLIFLEIGTSLSAAATSVTVNYTNSDGISGRVSTPVTISSFALGRWVLVPLQSGDVSVNSIESVTISGTAATTGSFNVIIVRQIISTLPIFNAGKGDIYGIDKLSNIPIHDDTFIQPVISSDSTTSGTVKLDIEIASA